LGCGFGHLLLRAAIILLGFTEGFAARTVDVFVSTI